MRQRFIDNHLMYCLYEVSSPQPQIEDETLTTLQFWLYETYGHVSLSWTFFEEEKRFQEEIHGLATKLTAVYADDGPNIIWTGMSASYKKWINRA